MSKEFDWLAKNRKHNSLRALLDVDIPIDLVDTGNDLARNCIKD